MLELLQAFCHTLKGFLAVLMLRPSFCGCDDQPTWTMDQTHSCLNLVPMLTSVSTGDKKSFGTIAFERCTIGRIVFHHSHLLLETTIPQAGRYGKACAKDQLYRVFCIVIRSCICRLVSP